MLRFIIRRILWGIALLFIVSAIVFLIFYILPSGDPAVLRAGRNAGPAQIAEIRHILGLDKPIYTQFWEYMKQVFLHFNFGYSYQYNVPVRQLIFSHIGPTAFLVVGAVLLWLTVGVSVGIVSSTVRRRPIAVRSRRIAMAVWVAFGLLPLVLGVTGSKAWQVAIVFWALAGIPVVWTFVSGKGSAIDRTAMGTSLALISAPVFWLGLVMLYLFAKDIGKFPAFPGQGSYASANGFFGHAGSLIMAWIVLAGATAAIYARYMRASMIEVMSEDYIRTARAKGVRERTVIFRHGVRSAITPIVTLLGLDVGTLLAGNAILTETVFNIPGIGKLLDTSINRSDLTTIQGITLMGAFFIIVFNLIVDIGYAYLDPRVRYS
jgi:peptide/nickel transport system permease protein